MPVRTAGPRGLAESERIEERGPEVLVERRPAAFRRCTRQKIERAVRVFCIGAGRVGERIGQRVGEKILSEFRDVAAVDVQEPARQPETVRQGHLNRREVPARIHLRLGLGGDVLAENVDELFVERDQPPVPEQADPGHDEGLRHGIGVLTGVRLGHLIGLDLAVPLHLGEADDPERLRRHEFCKIGQKSVHSVLAFCVLRLSWVRFPGSPGFLSLYRIFRAPSSGNRGS